MENKTKPSLFLVGNHLKLDAPSSIPFTEDMLTWPIVSFSNYPEPCPIIERDIILKNALSALMKLSPFNVKISVTAELENKRLSYEFRTWGKIFLDEENVLTFSHHSKKTNTPFYELVEWTEAEKDNEELFIELAKWSVEDWIEFFKKRIMERSTHLQNKADSKRADAQKLEDSANAIRMSINLIDVNLT